MSRVFCTSQMPLLKMEHSCSQCGSSPQATENPTQIELSKSDGNSQCYRKSVGSCDRPGLRLCLESSRCRSGHSGVTFFMAEHVELILALSLEIKDAPFLTVATTTCLR